MPRVGAHSQISRFFSFAVDTLAFGLQSFDETQSFFFSERIHSQVVFISGSCSISHSCISLAFSSQYSVFIVT